MQPEHNESQADLGVYVKQNTAPATATFVFGILLILMQLAIGLIYGFLVWLPPLETTQNTTPPSFSPIMITIILFLLVVVGFGSLFAYLKKLVWSALGFNLLIVCLTIEWFFLISLFWFKTDIRNLGINFRSGIQYNNIFLTNEQIKVISPTLTVTALGACLTQALKCALANCVAFSGVLGRAGPLAAFIIALIGTIGFELNRAIVNYVYFDYGGTYTIFVYGGFMSLIIGLLLRCREKDVSTTEKNIKYIGHLLSGSIAFFGASLLFAVFPILAADPETPWVVNGNTIVYTRVTSTNVASQYYNVPFSVWYCMASSAIVGSAFSIFVYAKLVPRDLLNSLIAGGVASVSAGFYFTNPVWPMVLGSACGMVQALVQGLIEKKVAMKHRIFNTTSFTLFGVQGIIGSIFAAIFRRVVVNRNDGITYNFSGVNDENAGFDIAAAMISAALGIGFGLISGLLVLAVTKHLKDDHFDDYTYWVPDDGIRYPLKFTPTPQIPIVVIPESEIYVKETVVNVKAKHAYL